MLLNDMRRSSPHANGCDNVVEALNRGIRGARAEGKLNAFEILKHACGNDMAVFNAIDGFMYKSTARI
jgi:hypothetical protein